MNLIEIHDLSKIYVLGSSGENVVKALDGVSLSIQRGEFVAIVGPSGSGKSTLLQILGLLDKPTKGLYKFLGRDVSQLSDDQTTFIRSRNIGFVFQLFNLLPRMSTADNTALPMIYRGDSIDSGRCDEVLQQLGMETHKHHQPSQLSGGQQQRVAVARALINQPDIIFADEPTGNLPRKQANELIDEFEKLNQAGITVVLITHDDSIASRAKRIIRIVDGKIQSDSASKETKKVTSPEEALDNEDIRHTSWNPLLWMETLKIASQSLARHKGRTFLTMLGVIIGVFSVISMLAIGEGAKKNMEYALRRMGSNMFRIQSQRPYRTKATKKRTRYSKLTLEDFEAIGKLKRKNPLIQNVSPLVSGKAVASYLGKSHETIVEGVSIEYESMRGNVPAAGRFFTADENSRLERVCVIGQTVYKELFKPNTNPIGSIIKINQKTFRLIGLLPAKGTSWAGDVDDVILIPYLTAMKRLLGKKTLSNIFVQARDEVALSPAMSMVTDTLRSRHRIRGEAQNDFRIKNYSEVKAAIEETTKTMTTFISIVALISLFVGGIGIMNIMLVSVSERTREIGIRKAIGARSRDILMQFLVESTVIALLGAALGVALALATGIVMRYALNWEVEFKLYAVLLSVAFSMFIGLFFGMYPARKASRLSPINALRYE